jgi:hypothetical protein
MNLIPDIITAIALPAPRKAKRGWEEAKRTMADSSIERLCNPVSRRKILSWTYLRVMQQEKCH